MASNCSSLIYEPDPAGVRIHFESEGLGIFCVDIGTLFTCLLCTCACACMYVCMHVCMEGLGIFCVDIGTLFT